MCVGTGAADRDPQLPQLWSPCNSLLLLLKPATLCRAVSDRPCRFVLANDVLDGLTGAGEAGEQQGRVTGWAQE